MLKIWHPHKHPHPRIFKILHPHRHPHPQMWKIWHPTHLFRAVEHDQFIKMVRMLRPWYIPPNRYQVGGCLLDQSFSSVIDSYSEELKGKTVCMAMDRWSNVHNEPILVLTLSVDGNIYIIDCVDTAESRHTAEYLVKIAENNAEKVKKRNLGALSEVL